MNSYQRFILFCVFVFLLLFLNFKIIYPAYVSTKLDCDVEYFEDNNNLIVGEYITSSQEIKIYTCKVNKYDKIWKHEMTHYYQSQRDGLFREYSCDNQIGVFLNEVESYLSEYVTFW